MSGPCAKQRVVATVVTRGGARFVGENQCLRPQETCPRADYPTGQGYHLCKAICHQVGHAEVVALERAGPFAFGATLYLEGHAYACADCLAACEAAGITEVIIGAPPSGEAMKDDSKPTNPKDAIAVSKLPLHLVPSTLQVFAALAFAEGAAKYGAYNWRAAGVRASVYKSALERHLAKWWNGEEADPTTNVPHLASALACIAIILDAQLCDKLTDDRPPPAPIGELIDDAEPLVAELLRMFADRKPHHRTIGDAA